MYQLELKLKRVKFQTNEIKNSLLFARLCGFHLFLADTQHLRVS